MRKKILHCTVRENGNVTILFAGLLVVLIFFIGLSYDIGQMCKAKSDMQNICHLIREVRFTYQDKIRYADNPGNESFITVKQTADANGFTGTVKVYFKEYTPSDHQRNYMVRTELSEDYYFVFAKILGLTSLKITETLDGGESFGDGTDDIIWYPKDMNYNGSYTSISGGGSTPGFLPDDLPAGW